MLKDLVLKSRSYRRFDQSVEVKEEDLRELVDLARLTPSGMNKQPLRYMLSYTKENNEKIFPTLKWAGYLTQWDGPEEGEKPSAYIVMLKDTSLGAYAMQDEGIVAQTILLGATEKGLGGCMFGSINRGELKKQLDLEEKYEVAMVIALGKPIEEVVIDKLEQDGEFKYWRDENKVHHVPKRQLEDLIIK
ncbi:nitroreductase [Sporanaerobium hydrogeniformans]|uniref:Nitroreductase n=1 Tax=Sporanaerobium hydrogeniformans TaxID=3072179 RepID=A0AC61DB71_9FIRM|nr:nitroreductase family protein [Sporanaerobium hydrogeniformans]PHV69971.1 nitroreductase [Sporanaerobium hydrogeniformans]